MQGKIHGKGTYNWPDGKTYVGGWAFNEMDGFGETTNVTGESYEGEYRNGLKHGQGTFTWKSGKKYTGSWENGKMHGLGAVIKTNGLRKLVEYVTGTKTKQLATEDEFKEAKAKEDQRLKIDFAQYETSKMNNEKKLEK